MKKTITDNILDLAVVTVAFIYAMLIFAILTGIVYVIALFVDNVM